MTPLRYAHFSPIPLSEIHAAGWIRDFLARQCAGLTGRPELSGHPYGTKFWGSRVEGNREAYLNWWPYEQTAYWLDGALKAGYLAGRDDVYRMALDEIDYAVDHAAPDGFIGPDILRERDRWPHAVFFRAVLAQAEISGDPRYTAALARHYRALPHPMGWNRDVTGVEPLVSLYAATGDADLLALAEDLYARYNAQFPEEDTAVGVLRSEKPITEHGVTFNEIAKLGALLYAADGRREYLEAALHGYAKVDRDQRLADGLHSCTEGLRGRDALDSHELCDVTDYTWSLGWLVQVTGEARFADRIEQVIFNALPGQVTHGFTAVQYFSCPNQVVANRSSNHNLFMRGFNWMQYRPDHEVQCCPGNAHRAMPNYAARMWLRDAQGGIVAALYGPGRLRTTVDGAPVTITAETRYPCEEAVEFVFELAQPARFGFSLRIPAWCADPAITLNGRPIAADLTPGTFYRLEREWQPGDRVRLSLPFRLALERWPGGGVSLTYGPLTLSLPVPTRAEVDPVDSTDLQRRDVQGPYYTGWVTPRDPAFPAWDLAPAGPWNYALAVDEGSLERLARVAWNPGANDPFDPARPPLVVSVPARRVAGWEVERSQVVTQFVHRVVDGRWQAGEREYTGDFTLTPPLPDPATLPDRLGPEERIDLVPYGCTSLRVTVFPSGC